MTFFTSYAQNFEDVLLWRALGHVKHGFYLDVGANDPHLHSVTQAFYERGWHGINVEPLPHFAPRFAELRAHDINLQMAAGASDGEITLYDVPDVDGWASSDRTVAEQHRAEGFRIVELTVPVRRLASICEQHVSGEIHFLKVDVEGFESEVLQGMDFTRWLPWIVVVEATLPNSQTTNHEQWEELLLVHGYRFAYFDGLNRYYVSPQHPELAQALVLQPNVFDNFHSIHLVRAWDARDAAITELTEARARAARVDEAISLSLELTQQLRAAHARMAAMEERRSQLQAQHVEMTRNLEAMTVAGTARDAMLQAKVAQVEALDARINAIYRSASWTLTRPLRGLGRLIRRLLRTPAPAIAQADVPPAPPPAEPAPIDPVVLHTLERLPAPARKVLADLEAAAAGPAGAP